MSEVNLTDYNGGALVATASIFLALSWISVGLRTYVRGHLTKSFQLDDWLMIAAQIVFTLSCAFILQGVREGLGRHNKALSQEQEIKAIMWQALATATYVLDMMFIKLSIGVFLLRLAVTKKYKYILYGALTVVGIWSIVLFFWDIFQCSPVEAQWDYTILANKPGSRCVSSNEVVAAAYSLSVMTIITDWLFALLPIPMVWNVKMTKQAKYGVIMILGLGIFASVATLIRLKFLADLNDVNDILYAGTDAMVWTLVEPGVAIVASSLVTIRPLLRAMRLRGFQSQGTGQLADQSKTNKSATNQTGTSRSGSNKPNHDSGDVAFVDLELGSRNRDKEPTEPEEVDTDTRHQPGRNPRHLSTASMPATLAPVHDPWPMHAASRRYSESSGEICPAGTRGTADDAWTIRTSDLGEGSEASIVGDERSGDHRNNARARH